MDYLYNEIKNKYIKFSCLACYHLGKGHAILECCKILPINTEAQTQLQTEINNLRKIISILEQFNITFEEIAQEVANQQGG